ncbi:HBL326Cp [Eremothecium sinecaudum]|uniref:Pre-mRNA-splicing factor CEF1 n=1 Tax=Eremothecium sinecaudum TaxID=45286 RepID=A0A125RDT9_9SACH|nr:HBL326Cp [Eremothecium sinecaudum]AMD18576.1 HBL326Cp [Eremothecium sinecaudum]
MHGVPIYVKGGVWTNLEDQILKAAIQKYGTHSWNKVASLLQKKSGKQCQNRWNEYLNPRLNFEKWSKEDDVKLLRLGKLLPNQWRTIGDMMGRTAQLCLDRYNKLLEEDGEQDTLRVGEFNPNADTQAARPDREELEDDEREMLAEARARLLNTQGKKATRKIRERMLEESKRVAYLQKRRELKQAGVDSKIRAPKKKFATQLDYNKEIPYEQAPVGGIYDTTEEDQRLKAQLEKFEKQVDKKGLRSTAATKKSTGKKKRVLEDASDKKIVGVDNVVNNEYKKPKLELPPSGTVAESSSSSVAAIRKEILANRSQGSIFDVDPSSTALISPPAPTLKSKPKAFLTRLFAQLPAPKNDFELVFEDDQVTSPNSPASPNGSQDLPSTAEDHAVDVLLPWTCESLERNDLTIPSPVPEVKDEVDHFYNLHIEAKRTETDTYENPALLQIRDSLLNSISAEEQNDHNPQVEVLLSKRPSPEALRTRIQQLQTSILSMSNQENPPASIIEQTLQASCDLTSTLLPKLLSNGHSYHLNYAKYQNEHLTIEERKAAMQLLIQSQCSST